MIPPGSHILGSGRSEERIRVDRSHPAGDELDRDIRSAIRACRREPLQVAPPSRPGLSLHDEIASAVRMYGASNERC
jgi:hypothetical protein